MLPRPTAAVAPGGRRPTPDTVVFDRGTLCGLAGHLQAGNGLLAAYTREVLQELVQGVAGGQVVLKDLNGHAGSGKLLGCGLRQASRRHSSTVGDICTEPAGTETSADQVLRLHPERVRQLPDRPALRPALAGLEQ